MKEITILTETKKNQSGGTLLIKRWYHIYLPKFVQRFLPKPKPLIWVMSNYEKNN